MRYRMVMTSAMLAGGAATGALAQEAPVELSPLTLDSAFRDERNILDTPVAASVREGEALESRQADTYEELIGDIPGLSIEGGPRGISQEPNIRGFQDEQIVLRFDGARFNFNQAHRGRFFLDPDIVQRVEVIRGGGSTLFGSGALGGVISVETKDPQDLLQEGRTTGARLRFGYSSNGDIGHGSATVFGDWGQYDALAFIGTRQFGSDLDDGDGNDIRNSQLDAINGLLKFGFEPTPDQRFEFNISRYDDEGTTPANSSSPSSPDDVDRDASVTSAQLSWDYAPQGSNWLDLSVLLYGNTLEITEDRDSDGRADETNYDTVGLEIVNRSKFDVGVPVEVVYGVEILRDTQEGIRDGAPRVQFPDADATTTGVFAEATWAVTDRLDLITGLRFDSYSRDPDSATFDDVDEDFFSPRIGFSYRPTDNWQIFGNVAQAFRAPSLSELYNDGVHFTVDPDDIPPGAPFSGVNRFVPNPDLEEEESTQFELGARFEDTGIWRQGDFLRFAANIYYADVTNFIDQRVTFIDFTTGTPGPTGFVFDGTTTSRNVDAEFWGLEAEVDYDAGLWFARAGLSLPQGEQTNGDPLGALPQERLTGTFGLRPSPDWQVGARVTLAADRSDVPDDSLPAEAFEVVDLFASWAPSDGPLAGAVIRAGVDNVFDEDYIIYPNGLSQPGRTFKISTSFQF
ncbi:MAG: TonB-dependent hemoglobin/transferrin/lactoferrin family receptor [Pseudomonadota bacterium]